MQVQKIIIGILLLFSCGALNAQNSGYIINGSIEGAEDGLKVRLKQVSDDFITNTFSDKAIDSTYIKDGKFTFTGSVEHPHLYTITIDKFDKPENPRMPLYQPVIPIFLENSNIVVEALLDSVTNEPTLWSEGNYSFEHVSVKGSKTNDTYMDYVNGVQTYAQQKSSFWKDYSNYLRELKDGNTSISQGIGIVTNLEKVENDRKEFMLNFIKENSDNMVGLQLAKNEVSKLSVSELQKLASFIPEGKKSTPLGKEVITKISEMKKVAPGAKYVDFTFNDTEGNPVTLSNHVGKGKYVLLELWASWCGPCRADIPHLKEVFELYNPEGFEIISISMDQKKEDWLKAVEEEQMPWLQIYDNKAFEGELAKTYKVRGIPTCILIDPDGKIVTRNMRGSYMDKRLIDMYGNHFGEKF